MNLTPLETLTQAKFAETLNTQFKVRVSPAEEVELELVEVASGPAAGPDAAQFESFSLIFHGPENRPLIQQTHPFEHAGLGRFDLFIVPIGRGTGVFKYQAVFNRRIRPA